MTLRPRLEVGGEAAAPQLQRRVPEEADPPVLPPCPQPDLVCSKIPSLQEEAEQRGLGKSFESSFLTFHSSEH